MALIFPKHLQIPVHSEKRFVKLRPDLVAVGGDVVVGLLLSQIVYWFSPTKYGKTRLTGRPRKGKLWVAKTRNKWLEETGLSPKQYRRAVKVLQSKNLIEVDVMKFAGVTQTHIRLLDLSLVKVTLPKGPIPMSPKGHMGIAQRATSYTESTTEITDTCSGDSAATSNVITMPVKKASPSMNIKQILQQKLTQPSNASLEAVWNKAVSLIKPGFQKGLSLKEKGQLAHLKKICGVRTPEMIRYTVEHWEKFAARAGVSAGCGFPSDPDIGFLVKHSDVAMNLLLQSIAPATPEVATPVPVVMVEPPAIRDVETPHKLTDDELAEMLEGLKE